MKQKLFLQLGAFLVLHLLSYAAHATEKPIENGVLIETATYDLSVQFYSPTTVRVRKWLPGAIPDTVSLVVIQNRLPPLNVDLKDTADEVVLSSDKLKVIIFQADGHIEYRSFDRTLLLKEQGSAQFSPVTYGNDKGYHISQAFSLSADEGIYGLGQHQDGYMNYRGKNVKLVQANRNAVSPFLISTANYGILWDNYSKTIFNDDQQGMSMWSDIAGNVNYYFIAGTNMDAVISGYRDLTGPAPMYGKWAYGYWQSKEHYNSRAELLNIAREYRRRKIPIDNIVQDWDTWEGNENWSQLFFDKKRYPDPKGMLDSLHDEHIHLMVSNWCAFGANTPVYKEMDSKGYLLPTIGWAKFKYFDVYNPAADKVYWNYLKKGFLSKGVDAWWMDSTEPDIINANSKESTEYELKRMADNHLGSFARYLNTYSLLATEGVYNNQRATTSDKRVYILTRSTFAGQQRAAATTWSGDIGASWEIYKRQIAAGLNHSMAGIPYWTFDIGAFVLGSYGGVFNRGGKDPAYQELYTRMFQFGAFCPIFRSHGSETPREIWRFGKFTGSLIKFDQLRYRLIPYIYSLAHQVTRDNYTIMRVLPMDFPNDKNTYTIKDQFMFGPSLLVCPVTEYMLHPPPLSSVPVTPDHFRTTDGRPGLLAHYYKDADHRQVSLQKIDSSIAINWYATGRPDYVTDSTLSIDWRGVLIPTETGKYQFHIKCYGPKRIFINGKKLPFTYLSVEAYTDTIELRAGVKYSFALETENANPGALLVELYWKTPAIFEREAMEKPKAIKEQSRTVYLPKGSDWVDFWTGQQFPGGQTIISAAPIDKIPLFLRTGSILPLGIFIQYAAEKAADTLELRIYAGNDGKFTLYDDENDNYDYERGLFSTIDLNWNDTQKELTVGERKGEFPGMAKNRIFKIVLVKKGNGVGIGIPANIDNILYYDGRQQVIRLTDPRKPRE